MGGSESATHRRHIGRVVVEDTEVVLVPDTSQHSSFVFSGILAWAKERREEPATSKTTKHGNDVNSKKNTCLGWKMVCAQDFFGTKTFRKVHFPNAFVIFLQAVATPRIRRVSGACVAKMTAECLGSKMDAKERKKIVQKSQHRNLKYSTKSPEFLLYLYWFPLMSVKVTPLASRLAAVISTLDLTSAKMKNRIRCLGNHKADESISPLQIRIPQNVGHQD